MDVIEQYRRSVAGFTERLARVRADQWSAPTPCEEWDVRALVNHIVYEERWLAPMLGGATIAEVGHRFDGDLLNGDPVGNAAEAAREADAAVAEPGAMERIVHLSFADLPGAEYLRQIIADHLVHSWDLAAAIGADRRLDPETVHSCAEWFVGNEDGYRQFGATGPRVALPADASEQDWLIAGFGRHPAWPVS